MKCANEWERTVATVVRDSARACLCGECKSSQVLRWGSRPDVKTPSEVLGAKGNDTSAEMKGGVRRKKQTYHGLIEKLNKSAVENARANPPIQILRMFGPTT